MALEFKNIKSESQNLHKYKKDDLDLSYEFSKKIIKELGSLVKAIVLFGSSAKTKHPKKGHDIDILIVVDDLSIVLKDDVVEAYRIIVERLVIETSTKIHVTTLKFTSFWEYTRVSDPIAINILRDGVAIYDTGFFYPLQNLLYRGKIRPTTESILVYYNRAPATLYNSKWHIKQAIIDLYWAVIDASHAALMKLGQVPPSPEHVTEMIENHLVKKKLISKRFAEVPNRFYHLMKLITYGDVKEISGEEFDRYFKEAESYVEHMKKFIEKGIKK